MNLEFNRGSRQIKINGHIVPLPGPLWDVLQYNNFVLVTLEPGFGRRNIFCFNMNGEQIWVIQQDDFFKVGNEGYECVVPGVLENEGRLQAYARGRPFFLDINTGKVEFIPGRFEK